MADPGSARVWSGDLVTVAVVLDKGHHALCWHNRRRDLLLIGTPDLVPTWTGAAASTSSLTGTYDDESL
jgi:hypothetical protein